MKEEKVGNRQFMTNLCFACKLKCIQQNTFASEVANKALCAWKAAAFSEHLLQHLFILDIVLFWSYAISDSYLKG